MGGKGKLGAVQRVLRMIYRDEAIPNAPAPTPKPPTPKLLRAMRSLVTTTRDAWQSRAELFVKQARLMTAYEDNYVYNGTVNQYFPTYDSLSDAQLRGYFTWRTAVRQGRVEKRGMSYASLYVYELLHLIGCRDAQDGYEKLHSFCEAYRALDPQIGHYIVHWEDEFVIYYGLDSKLITWRGTALSYREQDDAICTVLHRTEHTTEETMAAVCALSSYRLERSKLYRTHTAEVNAVALRVLDRAAEYYEKHRQISFFDDLIAVEQTAPVRLFSSAVFQPPKEEPDRVYEVHPLRRYECVSGYWTLHSYERPERAAQRLGVFLRGVDAGLRVHFGITAIQPPKLKKWQAKIIDEEITAFFAEQRAAEARRVQLDFSQLARIRADADVTQERLIVEEEEPPMMSVCEPSPVVLPSSSEDTLSAAPVTTEGAGDINGLDASELRLLRTLLGDGDLAWVRTEGRMLSVLVDGINEKLYDDFADTVIEGDPPAVVPDYQDELIERYLHGCE
ncbi:TerB N-terminal domain-containing protein [uncultured Selenomonas sp.]|uniref:TerB N-terminal domain-containing protein n=1 Tax=uncultured Selenomonas sp. TaxID=159275 RepID=UPI0028EF949B|nr:TerB N-terminal domain-containing protein [uncultured Selenomonas sp.]